MNKLIEEGKNAKAEEIADLAMEKMPIAYFEYYTLVEPFAEGYYDLGKKEKARKILEDLIVKYQESLNYFSGLRTVQQENYYMDIITDIERYRNLLWTAKEKEDIEFYDANKAEFNNYNKLFEVFGRDNE